MTEDGRQLAIATADRVNAVKWVNRTITFGELCSRLDSTTHTAESMAEYKAMKNQQRLNAKDHGGFVGGFLKDGKRDARHVEKRSMLTLDADHTEPDIIEKLRACDSMLFAVYTTHGHTAEEPRIRIIVPLTRDVSPDEYNALARFFADKWGIDQFDPVSFRPHQLMFWPSTPADGEYIFFTTSSSRWVDPDAIFGMHQNWQDITTLPKTKAESTLRAPGRKQEDPLSKDGVVGAFCRTYSIHDVMEKFLSDIYRPSAIEGRYDYIPASSVAGVLVYDDRWAYSHHATDPACGMLLNAFDLVRTHLFGSQDSDPDVPIGRQPSFRSMLEFAANDDNVKKVLIKEKLQGAKKEFEEEPSDIEWQSKLSMDKKGNIEDSIENLVLIIRNDPALKGLAYNQLSGMVNVLSPLPWPQAKAGWSDMDISCLNVYISGKYGIYSKNRTWDAFCKVISERGFHPIKDYLDSLPPWDGEIRVESLFIDYLGAENTPYIRAVTRKTLVAAVARIMVPGTKFDHVCILCGPQGIGKSTIFFKLGGVWFSDSLTITDMRDKAGAEKLQGYWIHELGELAGLKKTDVETVKSFISRTDDKFRPSYGRVVEDHPRDCIIVGSTNAEAGFLRDVTGNRRFWPVKVTGNCEHKPWELTPETVALIWAEALFLYKEGENLFLTGEEAEMAATVQSDSMEEDERAGLVKQFLDMLLPLDWANKDLVERRNYIDLYNPMNPPKDSQPRTVVSNIEIWAECFHKDPAFISKRDSYDIAAIMQKMDGWNKAGNRFVTTVLYGRQRVYERACSDDVTGVVPW